jgi:hypothetical protein
VGWSNVNSAKSLKSLRPILFPLSKFLGFISTCLTLIGRNLLLRFGNLCVST